MNIECGIPMDAFIGWTCTVCGTYVSTNYRGVPLSKYWNVEKGEVYCSAQHSLDRYEELERKAGK